VPTSWTERSSIAPSWFEGHPLSTVDGYALLDIVVPVESALAFGGVVALWGERVALSPSTTERVAPAPAFTERSV